jgi:hypothetical protein
VYVFKGTMNGLQPWRRLLAPVREAGDDFGAALATGRLDDDGKDDLLVGAPYLRPQRSGERSGAVFVYYGKRRGPDDRHMLHQENTGFTDSYNNAQDRYGAAIAVGQFDGTGRPEIAIGAPGDGDGGRVYVLTRGSSGFTRFDRLGSGLSVGDEFGAALLAADLVSNDSDELYVGSPEDGTASGAGHVYAYRPSASGFGGGSTLSEPNGPVAGDRFGAALAAGVFASSSNAARKLVVGAPGRSSGRGNLWILEMAFADGGMSVTGFKRLNQIDAGLDGQPGAELGAALAAGDFDGDGRDDIAAGAPRYDAGLLTDTGVVALLRGKEGGLEAAALRFQPYTHGAPERFDHYGSALATGMFNEGQNLDLAVGAPGKDPGNHGDDFSGGVWPLRGQPEGMPSETGSSLFFTDYLDQEYGVQR